MDKKAISACESSAALRKELHRCTNIQAGYFSAQLAAIVILIWQPLIGFPAFLAWVSLITVACLMAFNYHKLDMLYKRLVELLP